MIGGALSYNGNFEPEVQLRNLESDLGTLNFRLAYHSGNAWELGATSNFRSSFGPIGTAAVDAHLDVSTAGLFDVGANLSGALGATGLDASLSLYNSNPGTFSPTTAYLLDARPFISAQGVTGRLEVGLTRRLGRKLLLTATPELRVGAPDGAEFALNGALEYRHIIESDNASLLLEGSSSQDPARRYLAGGVAYALNRRELPPLKAALLLGHSEGGLRPGVRLDLNSSYQDIAYRIGVGLEPYKGIIPKYRASGTLVKEVGDGALGLELGAALANPYAVPAFTVRSSYALRF